MENGSATVTFTLRSPKAKQETSINLVLRYGKTKRIMTSTGLKAHPNDWNNEKGVFRKSYSNYGIYNRKLENLKETMLGVFHKMHNDFLKDNSKPRPDNENILKAYKDKVSGRSKMGLLDFFQNQIDMAGAGKILTKNQTVFSPNTVKDIRTSIAQMKAYEDHTGKSYDFNDINMNWYRGFIDFLQEKNYRANSVGKHIKNLKWVMSAAQKQDFHQNMIFKDSDFKVMEVDVQNIYLTSSEIEKIYRLDLRKEKRLEEIRDLFLVGYYTLQRYSDYSRINRSMLYTMNTGKTGLRINTQKTGTTVFLPFWGHLQEILAKYDFDVPQIVEQVFNREIKNICKEAGITAPFRKSEIRGGLKVDVEYKKYQLVTSHTARRSGASNAFLAGVPAMFIKMLTGHKTDANFLKYINVSQEEAVAKMVEHPFFKEGNLKVV